MGSCVSSILKSSKPTKAKLFDTNGQLKHIEVPVIAAEIMLGEPGTIVCCLDEIQKNRCLWAMRADEQLEGGKFYLICPAQRVYGKVSECEMNIIERACKKKGKVVGPKVFPCVEEEKEEEGNDTGFPGLKLRNFKQWRPMLEPIQEAF